MEKTTFKHMVQPWARKWPSPFLIQLFRERLSEKVHTTIPKGIVGGFECTVLPRNLKEWRGGGGGAPGQIFASAKGKQPN